jgi:hypothetical protein
LAELVDDVFLHLEHILRRSWLCPDLVPSLSFGGLAVGWLTAHTRDAATRVPEAARLRFANPLLLDSQAPRSVLYAIDHSPKMVAMPKD